MLYASKYDDIPLVVNICGRYDLKQGIAKRFKEDIFRKLEAEGKVQAPRKLPDGSKTTFWLTQEVKFKF